MTWQVQPPNEALRLLSDIQVTGLDVGARGGFTTDLLPIAPAVRAVGFEPDPNECKRLNASAAASPGPWRDLRFIPKALGRDSEERILRLYKKRGCSSLLEANSEVAESFSRGDYYVEEGTVRLDTEPLDRVAEEYGLENASFLKLDVQGVELEILETASKLLDELMVIRIEVSFQPIYRDQPLFEDIALYLRDRGFRLISFEEMHTWRRSTKNKSLFSGSTSIPFSRGELAHADGLFFKDMVSLPAEQRNPLKVLEQALIAFSYRHIDLGFHILKSTPAVNSRLAASGLTAERLAQAYSSAAMKGHIARSLADGPMQSYTAIKNLVRGYGKRLFRS